MELGLACCTFTHGDIFVLASFKPRYLIIYFAMYKDAAEQRGHSSAKLNGIRQWNSLKYVVFVNKLAWKRETAHSFYFRKQL